jgi:hypothetical protein
VFREHGNADTGLYREAVAFDLERSLGGFADLVTYPDGLFFVGVREEYRELVSGEPGQDIGVPDRFPQADSYLLDQEVTVKMSQGGIDLLETVYIDQQQGERFLGLFGSGDLMVDLLVKIKTVRQAGQVIVHGPVVFLFGHHSDMINGRLGEFYNRVHENTSKKKNG